MTPPVPHARCGTIPVIAGATVKCPKCQDVTVRRSLAEAVAAWNEQQITAPQPAAPQAQQA